MRRIVGIAVAALCATALAGCWPAPGQGPDRRAENPFETKITAANAAGLAKVWESATLPGGAGPPVVEPGSVYVRNGAVTRALESSTGAHRWTFDPGPDAPTSMSDPVVHDKKILTGWGFGNLGGIWNGALLDPATGAQVQTIGGGLIDSVRGGSAADVRYSFGSGTPVAIYLAVQTFAGTGPNWSGLLDIVSGGSNPRVAPVTLGTDGLFMSSFGSLRKYPHVVDYSCNPPGAPYNLLCPAWTTPLDGGVSASPVLGDGVAYVGTAAGTLYAIDQATGAVRWTAAVGAPITKSPAVARGHVYVPTSTGAIVVLPAGGCGAATCAAEWSYTTGSEVSVQPAVAGDVLYAGSASGAVTAFDADGCGAASCPSLWSANAGSAVSGAPAVANGRLYVGTGAGSVVAYGLP